MARWLELGAGVYVSRHETLDQSIGVVVGREAVLVVDTLTSVARARKLLAEIGRRSLLPVAHVVNTHAHADHVFGNAAFQGAALWAQRRMPAVLAATAAEGRAWLSDSFPLQAAEIEASPVVLPGRLVDDVALVDLGGRVVELRHAGRGHTDHDLVAIVPDARVVFAGDLVEMGGPPAFEDAFPLDWSATLATLADLPVLAGPSSIVVPGHGEPGGRQLLVEEAALMRAVVDLAARVESGDLGFDAAVDRLAFAHSHRSMASIAVTQARRQLRGELG